MPCVVITVGEGSLLYPLSHKHLLTLLATTWDSYLMPCVLIVGKGNLLYLLSHKHLMTLLATTWD